VQIVEQKKQYPIVGKCDIVIWLKSETSTKVAKLAKDFDIPTTALTADSKNKDKVLSHFFLLEYTRKHDKVSGNPNQRKFLTLARRWG